MRKPKTTVEYYLYNRIQEKGNTSEICNGWLSQKKRIIGQSKMHLKH